MSKEERFETQFDGNKWLVADKENDTLLGGFGSVKMLNEFVDKISDLEAKLAEKDTRIAELEDKDWYEACIKQLEEQNGRLIKERDNAKLQLACKEKEIESYEHELEVYKQNDNVYARNMNRLAIRHNQEKISFAVEQLEKVKNKIENNISPIIFQDSYWLGKQTVLDKIDNQIKQLKEMIKSE